MTTPLRRVESLVIGGGPAGAMAAIKLAEAGREVLLVEKEPGPHDKVCGEFLSREAIGYLGGVSVFPEKMGAQPIRAVRLFCASRKVEAELPFPALSLSRRLLDAALLARAAEAGCEVERGDAVVGLNADEAGWRAKLSRGADIVARTVFLASGKHDLRGWNRARGAQGDLVGFKLHWRLAGSQIESMREAIELFLFSGGYGGMVLIEKDAANLCLVVRRAELRKHGGWDGLLAAMAAENGHLRERLGVAEALYARPLAICPIPYGYLAGPSDGLWRIGDQAAVIPSFTGDGISIALHSAALAVQMHLLDRGPHQYMNILHGQLRRSMRVAVWLSRAMVTAAGRGAAPAVLSVAPWAMCLIAAATRIPRPAIDLVESQPQGLKPMSTWAR